MNVQLFQQMFQSFVEKITQVGSVYHKDASKRDAGESESEGSEMLEAEVGVRPLLEGATSQGIQVPLEVGEGRELILSWSLHKKTCSCLPTP